MKNHHAESCASCDIYACPLNVQKQLANAPSEKTAFLLDEFWPEYATLFRNIAPANTVLCTPLRPVGKRFRNYAWPQQAAHRHLNPYLALRRSLALRGAAGQGGARTRILLDYEKRLARSFLKHLGPSVTRLVVAQGYLPWLHESGALGGRHVTVLMQRYPAAWLQQTLDAHAAKYPESPTLGDYRAPAEFLLLENQALERADLLVTPHAGIAELFPTKTHRLPWQREESALRTPALQQGQTLFIGPTVGRRGAYAVRDFIAKTKTPLLIAGHNLEGSDIWQNLPVTQRPFGPGWLEGVSTVLAPALFDHRPHRLLQALEHGATVYTTSASGLPWSPKVRPFEEFDK